MRISAVIASSADWMPPGGAGFAPTSAPYRRTGTSTKLPASQRILNGYLYLSTERIQENVTAIAETVGLQAC